MNEDLSQIWAELLTEQCMLPETMHVSRMPPTINGFTNHTCLHFAPVNWH